MNRSLFALGFLYLASCSLLVKPDLPGEVQCEDGVDNDNNELADCQDPACAQEPNCNPENLPPEAVDDQTDASEDNPINIPVGLLIENDSDPEGQALQITAVSDDTNGTATLNGDQITFSPDPDFNGQASFTYTVSDSVNTDTATVTITVAPVNDPPVAVDDTLSANENTPRDITPDELLLNDSDVEDDPLSIVSVDGAQGGVVSFVDNEITFTPDEDFEGPASFTYTITDNTEFASATVTIDIIPQNDPPVAVDDSDSTDQDVPLEIAAAVLLLNDVDTTPPTFVSAQNAQNGTVSDDGVLVTFTPAPGFVGNASFEYTITDGSSTDSAQVFIAVLPAVCGNNIPQTGEECDDGNTDNNDGCSAACVLEVCGDGIVNNAGTEQCDDGNTNNNDGCSAGCVIEVCGDAIVNNGEACDDGNIIAGDGCNAACVLEFCGDNITNNNNEQCDDGNVINDDGCSNACQLPSCGDGILQALANEECDDGNSANGDGCSAACVIEFCGDNTTNNNNEQCDDGNIGNGDGCNEVCALEVCGDGIVNNAGTEQCDDGNLVNNDSCSNACRLPACGDNIVQASSNEQCDDGNLVGGDGCDAACQQEIPPSCGNGALDAGEQCDDANLVSGDGCSAACVIEVCGDGIINNAGTEQCDDGNTSPNDGCNAACVLEVCGDGIINNGEVCDDGNTAAGDGCRSQCDGVEVCGDGLVDSLSGEQCDDGNTNNFDGCSSACLLDEFVSVPPQIISGGLTCSTAQSNTGRKISSDALGNFYVVMNCGGEAFVVSSTDRGQTYSAPLSTGIAGLSEVAIEGGPARVAYVAAITGGNLVFTRTIDGGLTWQTPAVLSSGFGDSEVSIDSFGDDVFISVSSGQMQIFRNNNRGIGAFNVTILDQANVFHEIIVDKTSGDVISATDTPDYHVRRSTDGAVSFAAELNPPGQAFFSDWAGSNGLIYVVGTGSGALDTDVDVIPFSNLGSSTQAPGLPTVISNSQGRAIDADPIGNAYISSSLDGGGIQLDRLLLGAPSVDGVDARLISPVGSFGGVAAIPSNTGALIVYTEGTNVLAALVVYSVCGDGNQEPDEECDDGNLNDGDGCDAACLLEVCGNGVVQTGEECDDRNTTNGDGCDAFCTEETGFDCIGAPSSCLAICGDGLVLGDEECDDSNTQSGDGCSAQCAVEFCGDGVVNNAGTEECDDGNTNNNDGCSSVCVVEFCGDGIVNASGNVPQSAEFIWLATSCNGPRDINFFFNGTPALTIQGDSGSCICTPGIRSQVVTDPQVLSLLQNGDNDFAVSFVDNTGNALLSWAVVIVDNGNPQEVVLFDSGGGTDALDRNPDLCNASFLGDVSTSVSASLVLAIPEQCDDANLNNGDGCENDCTLTPVCGNGIVESGEQCDDANLNNGDGCSAICQAELVAIDFQIASITGNNCQAIEHVGLTGDDRGGIAANTTRVLYTGDTATGSFDANALDTNNAIGFFDSLASDLGSGRIFSLGNGATPIPFGGGTITSLLEINPINGAILGQLNLSQPIAVNSTSAFPGTPQTGIFSGVGRITILATPDNGSTFRIFDINTLNGQVFDLGPSAPIVRAGCENWATWGVAEFFNGQLFLTYTDGVFPVTQVLRTRVSDGFTEVVATFAGGLSDMCSLTVVPGLNRWYFHHEGGSVFRSGDETIGFCDASFIF